MRLSNCYKALFMLPATTLFDFFPYFKDFYVHANSVVEAHLPNWYLLLRFCPQIKAQHYSEPRLKSSFCYKALFTLPAPPLFKFFRDFEDFYVHANSVDEAHLPNWYLFSLLSPTDYSPKLFLAQI